MGRAGIPLDVRELMQMGARYTEERDRSTRVSVIVELDAADWLIDAAREALRPATASASLQVDVAEAGRRYAVAAETDVVIALAGSCREPLRDAVASVRALHIPCVVMAFGEETTDRFHVADALYHPGEDVFVDTDAERIIGRLGTWMSDHLAAERLALARNFPFMRRAVAEEIVKTTSIQNAIVGVIAIVPGADMPVMTANQAKMLLQIAAVYGQPLGVDRVKELAGVVGGGFLLRAVARQALVAVPVLGWAVKGGIGYTGTYAMGQTAIGYFEEDADIGRVTARLRDLAQSAAARIPRKGASARRIRPVRREGAAIGYSERGRVVSAGSSDGQGSIAAEVPIALPPAPDGE